MRPIVNRGVHLHPLSLNSTPPKTLVGASLQGYSLHCIIFRTAIDIAVRSGIFLIEIYNFLERHLVDLYADKNSEFIDEKVVPFAVKRALIERCY